MKLVHMFAGAGAWLVILPSIGRAADINVAAAANGGTVFADSEFTGSTYDEGGLAPASRLIDGIIGRQEGSPFVNRWHSALSQPHPHWACVKLARPARIHRVVLWRADIGSPIDIEGQWSPDHGRTVRTLFVRKGMSMDESHPSVDIEFQPVTTDSFRLVITRSSNPEFPNYTQLSELQIFGEWAAPPVAGGSVRQALGEMLDTPMPAGLRFERMANEIAFSSRWLKVVFPLDRPGISFLSLDGLGGSQLSRNFLKGPRGVDVLLTCWDEQLSSENVGFTVSRHGNVVRYAGIGRPGLDYGDLVFTVGPRSLHVAIELRLAAPVTGTPLRALFDVSAAVATPLGRLRAKGELLFPVLLHFADHGTLLVRAKGADTTWKFTGNRGAREIELAVTFPKSGKMRRLDLDMKMAQVYPERAVVDADPKLAGVKRGWLNMFGFRPDIACLSNNIVSDNCQFCMYEYADHAFYTPRLFDDFTALDLVRMSLDGYLDGAFGYGNERDVMLDSDPAIVISAWDYAVGKRDTPWLRRRISGIERYADHIIACDKDGDGLSEAKRTGNSGSGIAGAGEWASNWWDVVSFGWKDAYCNALDYRAFRCLADLERRLGRKEKADLYARRAKLIKECYYSTFNNPKTGVLAGWRSKDGQLHDYYFTFISGIAISYGLVTHEQGEALMDHMLAKMKDVGYTNFRIGLPGNLVPVARKDYAGGGVLGQPSKDDGSDSFQSYENGGATAGFAYFTIQALYALGRKGDAERIFGPMLEGYAAGVYQNGVGSGVDWKRWDGTPCGYEGLLTDSYYALDALITGRLGKGVPIP